MTRIFIQQLCVYACVCAHACVCVCVCVYVCVRVCGLVEEALCLVQGRRGNLQTGPRHTLSSSLVRQAKVNNSL